MSSASTGPGAAGESGGTTADAMVAAETSIDRRSIMSAWSDWLTDVADPRFGQWVTWLLLVFSVVLAISPIEFSTGTRSESAATIFAWLPETLIRNPFLFTGVRCLLVVSAVLWAFRWVVPITCWTTTILFALMWSLRMENLANGAHIFNVTNNLLFIQALWFTFYWSRMKSGLAAGAFYETPCYPRWAFLAAVFYIGWFHALAGFTKIWVSGLGWGSGVSLQLWTELFGQTASPFAQIILYDSRLTAFLQTGALVIECGSILCIFHRYIRYAVGVGLTGFYLGVLTTFITFGFHFNAILVAVFLLPLDAWMGLKFRPVANQPVIKTN